MKKACQPERDKGMHGAAACMSIMMIEVLTNIERDPPKACQQDFLAYGIIIFELWQRKYFAYEEADFIRGHIG